MRGAGAQPVYKYIKAFYSSCVDTGERARPACGSQAAHTVGTSYLVCATTATGSQSLKTKSNKAIIDAKSKRK